MFVDVINSRSELDRIRPDWERLQAGAPIASPNVDYQQYVCVLDSLDKAAFPHVICVRNGSLADALLVGRIDNTQLCLKVGYKKLQWVPIKALSILHGGVLGIWTAERAQQVLLKMRECLSKRSYNLVRFNMVPASSPLVGAISDVFPWWQRDTTSIRSVHHQLKLPDTMEHFFQSKSKNHRSSLRKSRRRMAEGHFGEPAVQCFRQSSEIDEMLTQMETIAKASYQRGLKVGFMNDKTTRAQLELAARLGWLRGYVLSLESEPVAFQLGIQYGTAFFGRGKGYARTFAHTRPGQYLFLHILEELIQEGQIGIWDFGIGDAEYKRQLCNVSWEEVLTHLFPQSLKGLVLNLVHTGVSGLDRLTRRAAEELEIDAKLKKRWREWKAPRLPIEAISKRKIFNKSA